MKKKRCNSGAGPETCEGASATSRESEESGGHAGEGDLETEVCIEEEGTDSGINSEEGRIRSGINAEDGNAGTPIDMEGENEFYVDDSEMYDSVRLREAEVAYGRKKRQGEFTLEDYYALPDDVRVELIDGVIYDMSAPVFQHQTVVTRLAAAFTRYIDEKRGRCKAVAGPVDVQLDCDDRTMVQPDVLILCNMDQLRHGVVFGAPDLVVEVLSPSTRKKDRTLKLKKYREAGVREYWIIDLNRKEVEVYFFKNPEYDTLPRVYGFQDVIPVEIYGGDCQVDFADVSRWN